MLHRPLVPFILLLIVGMALPVACTVPGPAVTPEPSVQPPTATVAPATATTQPSTATPTQPPATPQPEMTPLHLSWVWPEDGPGLIPVVTVSDEGVLYVADRDGALHALATPGDELWSVSGDCGQVLPPVSSADGSRLYLVGIGETRQVCAFNTDGALVWQTPVAELAQPVPVLAPDGALHLRTETGAVRISPEGEAEEYVLPEAIVSSLFGSGAPPVIDGAGNVYFAQDMANKVWVLSPNYEVSAECEVEDLRSDIVTSSGEGFLVAAGAGDIIAYDVSCGERWRYAALDEASDDIWLALAVGRDGVLYAGGPGGLLLALSEEGEELWRNESQVDAPLIFSLAIGADGTIAAAADQPTSLLAFGRNGEPLLAQELYQVEETGLPSVLPDGSVAQVHEGRLEVYTSDPALVVAVPTPAPPPQSVAEAEAEIAQFMVDTIVEEEIEGTSQYIEDTDWYGTGPTKNLIVWSDVLEPEASEAVTETNSFLEGIPELDSDNPRQVWSYDNGELLQITGDVAQKLAAIDAYREDFMDMETEQSIFAWGFYEFAIVSLDPGLLKAEVYRSISCGPLCGSGYLLTLERAPDGDWYVSDSTHLWQS